MTARAEAASPRRTAWATGTFRPLLAIWLTPGQTIARIAHENPSHGLHTLTIVAGLSYAAFHPIVLITFLVNGEDAKVPAGPLANLFALYINSYLLAAIAGALGGKATPSATRVAISWSYVPLVALLPIDVASIFLTDTVTRWGGISQAIAIGTFVVVQVTLQGWSWVIFVRGLASINGFSWRRAVLAALLGWSIALITLILFARSNAVVYTQW